MLALLLPYKKLLVINMATVILGVAFSLLTPLLFGRAVSAIEAFNDQEIILYGSLVILAGFLSAFVFVIANYYSGILGLNVEVELRATLYGRIVELDTRTFEERPPADLLSRILVASGPIKGFLTGSLPGMFSDALTVILSAIIMFFINPVLALVGLWPVPIVLYMSYRFAKRQQQQMVINQQRQGETMVQLSESIEGVEVAWKFDLIESMIASFNNRLEAWFQSDHRLNVGNSKYLPVITNLPEIGATSLLLIGGMYVIDGHITLSVLVVFIGYLSLMYGPIESLGSSLWSMLSANGSAVRVWEILDSHSTMIDPDSPKPAPEGETPLHFDRVSVLGTDGHTVLDEVAIQIGARQNAVLVGSAGSGKSSLMDLLQRIYEPSSGHIWLGNVSLGEMGSRNVRKAVKYVGPQHHIFKGTIADNIKYGAADATDTQIQDVCRIVDAQSWIEQLSDGTATAVGEGGHALTLSQRAQISLARALITNPRILLLDGATDVMPAMTERTVANRIREATSGISVIAVAHRASLFALGGEVIILDGGVTVAAGEALTLARESEEFRELLRATGVDPDSLGTETQ